jgi:hypothetical protein
MSFSILSIYCISFNQYSHHILCRIVFAFLLLSDHWLRKSLEDDSHTPLQLAPPNPPPNKCKAFFYHTQRRKTQREERERAVVPDGMVREELIPMTLKMAMTSETNFSLCSWLSPPVQPWFTTTVTWVLRGSWRTAWARRAHSATWVSLRGHAPSNNTVARCRIFRPHNSKSAAKKEMVDELATAKVVLFPFIKHKPR